MDIKQRETSTRTDGAKADHITETFSGHLLTVVKGAFISFTGTVIGKFLLLVFTVIIGKTLGPRSVGLYFLGLAIMRTVAIPVQLGLNTGIVRYVALYRGERNTSRVMGVVLSAFLLALPVSILAAVSLLALSKVLSVNIFHKPELANVLVLFSLSLPFFIASQLFLATLQALKQLRHRTYIKDLLDNGIKVLFAILTFVFGWQLFGILIGTIMASISMALLGGFYVNKHIRDSSTKPSFEFKELINFSIPQTFSQTLWIGLLYVDTLILGIFRPAAEVGIYSLAAKLALVVALFLESFNIIFAPMISTLAHRKEIPVLARLFKAVTKWIFTLSLPVALFLIISSKPIMQFVGREYAPGSLALAILATGQLINVLTGPSGIMIIMSGRPVLELVCNILAFSLNLILNVTLIPTYGILGAAISTSVSIALINILRVFIVWFSFRMQPFKFSYLKSLLAGAIASLVAFLTSSPLSVTPAFQLIVFGIVLLAIYGPLLFVFGIDVEDKSVLETVKSKIANSRIDTV